MQTVLFQVCDIWSVSTLRLLLIAWQSWQVESVYRRPARLRQDSDARRPALCVPSAPKPSNCPAGACFSVGLRSCARSLLPSRAVQPNWASGKFKLMSGPVTSWPEQGAARDPRPTSDISQKVPCVGNVFLSQCMYTLFYHNLSPKSARWWLNG